MAQMAQIFLMVSFFVTTNVPDFNHHKGTKTLRTPRISKLFLFFVPLCPRALRDQSESENRYRFCACQELLKRLVRNMD